mmetsp:Transcript_14411/g.29481  ORF Transcript_14411/g.29481 Transcript_14411/m.29481 type:complete len:234 (-) Transcript_14411:657-1358(-)
MEIGWVDMVLLMMSLVFCLFGIRMWKMLISIRARRRRVCAGAVVGTYGQARARRMMVVLGSGGHTAEMLDILEEFLRMDSASEIELIAYVVAATDGHSERKALELHAQLLTDIHLVPTIHRTPRAREVGQSYLSSVVSTLIAFSHAWILVLRDRPTVIVCNGPGTCIPITAAALIFNAIGITDAHIVYVESVARVKTLSLSGKILYPICHRFLVQWTPLKQVYPLAEFYGRLV